MIKNLIPCDSIKFLGGVGQVVPPIRINRKNYRHFHLRINKFHNSINSINILRDFLKIEKGNCNLEKGEKGIEHFQMTITLPSKMTELTLCNKVIQVMPHLTTSLNKQGTADGKEWYVKPSINEGSNRYCMKKDETFLQEIFSIGDILSNENKKYVETINYFYGWQRGIIKILDNNLFDRHIYVYIGDGGCGKTTFCKWIITHYDGVILLSGKSADMKNSIIEYVETNKILPKTVIVNIPRSFNKDYLSYTGIEEIKDMLFYSGKYKGGMICDETIKMIIFSNSDLDYGQLSFDRWIIRYIENPNTYGLGLLFG